ncbi:MULTISPECIES: carbohydrate ABC transporter permease [unclassified Pseudofrankia]|uniref:carbohydrate ABC transporter permease n=1 Tax=unclassified Pseudofrankia TaxID=2994372 RepID=UPI0008DB3065|nr:MULTISPECIES: carbohydrate ABC transporter permease [unclassified Pseudofrankia]MDT3442274.1 carbohydrate ABC transporter permease [Pseudofrankia sp. BMG5.37]OHV60264.1 ABC transporter permease [Pseudofrankia sp. BMG5.36]
MALDSPPMMKASGSARRPGTTRALWRRRHPGRIWVKVVIGLLLVVEVYPLLWMFLTSLKSNSDYLNKSTWSLPTSWEWGNYSEAWTTGHIGLYVRNSLLATAPALLLIIVLGTAAGFALQIMVWKGRGLMLIIFLAGIMVPSQMILLPLFTVYFRAGLSGTLWPLILTYTGTGLPLTVFMMATYYRAVPRELFEAATIDGAGILRSFWSISIPMVRNAILTVGLVQFFFIWNDLLIALTFTNNQDLRTIQVGLLNFTGDFGATQYGPLFAAICINVIGTLVIYLFLNQKVMKGLTGGAVKG